MRSAHLAYAIATALAVTVLPGIGTAAVAAGPLSATRQIPAPAGVMVTDPSTSADGRWVAFVGQVDGVSAIYRHDSVAQTTERIATRDAQGDLAGLFAEATISGDGNKIAFTLHDDDHSGDGWDPQSQVYLTDTRDNHPGLSNTTLMSGDYDGNAGDDGSAQPALSADGRFLAFSTRATNVINGAHRDEAATDGADVALRDLSDGRIDGISEVVEGVDMIDPTVNGDGSRIVFTRDSLRESPSRWLFERPNGVYGGGETLRRLEGGDEPAPVAVWNPLVWRAATPARDLGYVLQADPADWGSVTQARITRQWLRDGRPIRGAKGLTYEVTSADMGRQLAVREHLKMPGAPTGEVTSRAYHVKKDRSVLTTPKKLRQNSGKKIVVRVRVTHRPGGESYVDGAVEPQGRVRVKLGKQSAIGTVGPRGWVRLVLKAQRPGKYKVRVLHRGTGFVAKAPTRRIPLVVRPAR